VLLLAKGLNAKDIHKSIFPVSGGKCLLRKVIHNWVEKLSQGLPKITDDARPGRPVEIATVATVQRVEELIRADRRITIGSVATALRCSHGLAYSTVHDRLKFRKVCTWIDTQRTGGLRKNGPNVPVLATSPRLAVCR
jgi:hypothetical protein